MVNDAIILAGIELEPRVDTLYTYDDKRIRLASTIAGFPASVRRPEHSDGELFERAREEAASGGGDDDSSG